MWTIILIIFLYASIDWAFHKLWDELNEIKSNQNKILEETKKIRRIEK